MVAVFLPASVGEVKEKAKLFKKHSHIGFGFEIKGSYRRLETFLPEGIPFGIHLPSDFMDEWGVQKEEKKEFLKGIAFLTPPPRYVVVHGGSVHKPKPEDRGYLTAAGMEEYRLAVEEFTKMAEYCQQCRIPIYLENTAFTDLTLKDGVFLPETHLNLRIGNFSSNLLKIKEKARCGLVLDVEHLGHAINFIQRKENYSDLPKWQELLPKQLSSDKNNFLREYGLLFQNRMPVIPIPGGIDLMEEIRKIGVQTKIYHLTGGYGECKRRYVEVAEGRVVSHSPIDRRSEFFNKILNVVMEQKPEVLVVETATSKDNVCWAYLQKNSLERSFEELCSLLESKISH